MRNGAISANAPSFPAREDPPPKITVSGVVTWALMLLECGLSLGANSCSRK